MPWELKAEMPSAASEISYLKVAAVWWGVTGVLMVLAIFSFRFFGPGLYDDHPMSWGEVLELWPGILVVWGVMTVGGCLLTAHLRRKPAEPGRSLVCPKCERAATGQHGAPCPCGGQMWSLDLLEWRDPA